MSSLSPLPIDAVLPEVVATLRDGKRLVLEAPPGAGKTTRVPRAMLDAGMIESGEVVVLEPRRLAARLAARRVADELGEKLGETVGYTVRFEDVSSKKTKIRFVTEGVLTRRLLAEPDLRGVSAVLLDEFHERHLQGDVALALLRRLQRTRRPDLGLVAMSATLDAAPVAEFLESPVVRSEGKRFDVAIEHIPAPDDRKLELQVASAVRALVGGGLDGHVLVFLPGASEIRRAMEACEKLAQENDLALLPLHGDLSPQEQDRAVGQSPKRKIILSTNVAESSVTIDGVVAVIDSGLARVARHAPWSGLPTLEVAKVSRASARQRAGRAGRTRAGKAIRLYTKADFETRPEHDAPEILRVDLSQTLLELHASGARDLAWLDAPKPEAVAAAEDLLARLGALEPDGKVTDLGRRMLTFPLHPRQARMLVEAERRGVGRDGALLAALVGERDLRTATKARFDRFDRGGGGGGGGGPRPLDVATERSDLLGMLDLFHEAEGSGFAQHTLRAIGLDPGAVHAVERARKQLSRMVKPGDGDGGDEALLISVLAGFPDRVARRKRQGSRDLALAQGGAAELAETSAVRDAPWMVAVDAELSRGRPVVRVASGIEPEWLIDLFADRIRDEAELAWDDARGTVTGSSRMMYDALAIDESAGFDKSDPRVAELLAEKAKKLLTDEPLVRWLARVRFAASQDDGVKAPSDDEVKGTLRALCAGKTALREVEEAGLLATLQADLASSGGLARLDALAPDRVALASGRSVRVEYEEGKPPWLESYLQDFFGTKQNPRAGRVPVVLHLLAPNRRAVQVTTDLSGFWERHYPAIRKELMRKYPRHAWPEDTSIAVAPKGRGGR